jgi:hypothetical protein
LFLNQFKESGIPGLVAGEDGHDAASDSLGMAPSGWRTMAVSSQWTSAGKRLSREK